MAFVVTIDSKHASLLLTLLYPSAQTVDNTSKIPTEYKPQLSQHGRCYSGICWSLSMHSMYTYNASKCAETTILLGFFTHEFIIVVTAHTRCVQAQDRPNPSMERGSGHKIPL